MRTLLLLSFALLTACDGIPRDPEGTLERIRRDQVMHVGMVDGASLQGVRLSSALVAALAEDTRARPVVTRDTLEPLLVSLEAGKLDLVVGGRFAEDTPWKTRVTLGPPLATQTVATSKLNEHAVTRNGENAWIVLVQREAKALALP
jgi:ABC-type amino acid transport substrate-binding protein